MGVHTAIESNGYLGERLSDAELGTLRRFKWHALGIKYQLEDVEPPSPDALERALEIFRAQGLTAY